ncbi:hypothetical protein GCK72_011255 [Caenorhabditis remanei]|uniref:Uncharacterized protein n=1 Tax=Caenorhabditis remanei TaxID=31234 RepID=A0A6A5H585_CAERE|nr:hypothetical protein GCK72_011255 [Caenorhabditis remanei]KAF1762990.1 hypothetical protein GCK72_011255 [Caenorhabditis remanei]
MTDNPADPPLNDQPPPNDPAAAVEDLLLNNNDIEMIDVSPKQEAEILGDDATETSTEETQESTGNPSSVSLVHGEENSFRTDRSSEMNPATPVANETNSALEKNTSLPEDRSSELNSVTPF